MKKSDKRTFSVYLEKVFKILLDFIWPQFCLGCGCEGALCCAKCFQKLKILPLNPLPWPIENKFFFQACYVCLDYKNILIKKLIKSFKYKYLENISNLLADILYQQAKNLNLPAGAIVCNIPLHKKRKLQRGFDQTELLAKKLALKLNLTYQPLLTRIKNTKSQADLDKKSRELNMTGAFALNKKTANFDSSTKTILLIDDLTTTGATLNQAARALKDNGWPEIICLVIAKN
jgi:competence protein ComFC